VISNFANENPNVGEFRGRAIKRMPFAFFDLRIAFLVLFFLAGCAAPGEPTPPSPPIPTPVSDLMARQQGDGIQLRFTIPQKTISGDLLTAPPSVEIFRGTVKPNGSPDKKSFRMIYTVPGALVNTYTVGNRMQFTVPISPRDTLAHPGALVACLVRTRASHKRSSANSNIVKVRMFPVPERIASIEARVGQSSIELSWPSPTRTSANAPLQRLSGYRVYRGEITPASAQAAASDLSNANWMSPLVFLATSASNNYRDTLFHFGKTYVYTVRSVVIADGVPLESDDSVPAIVTPRDVFPPKVPQNLVANLVTPPAGSPEVDLSWSINLETDLAGYRVYRSEQQGTRGELLTSNLLLTPAYRDTSVLPGHSYWYTVTAVDLAGNESAPSSPVAVSLARPTP
jgi:hypothetical protein